MGAILKPTANLLRTLLDKLFKRLPIYRGPVLGSSYNVSDHSTLLATLTKPRIPDQFWIEFLLTPKTQVPTKLETLYSWDFWNGDCINITETETGRRVQFFPALQLDETEDEVIEVDYLKDHPTHVTLRGPYEYEIGKEATPK